jgi:hypothetical protein
VLCLLLRGAEIHPPNYQVHRHLVLDFDGFAQLLMVSLRAIPVFLVHVCTAGMILYDCARQHYDNDNSQCKPRTSAGSSEELAESHVNKTTRLATEDSESPGGDSEGAIQAPSRHPPSIPPET